jgi:glycerophosphoryl diester phosphodiesterase
LTRDGELVVLHDATLQRTTTGHGPVGEQTWNELRAFTLKGTSGERIPRLAQVLDLVADSQAGLVIEIKSGPRRARYPGIEERLVTVLESAGAVDRVTVTAFDWEMLARVRSLTSALRLAGVLSRRRAAPGGLQAALDALLAVVKATDVAVEHTLLSGPSLRRLRATGLALGAWTPNTRATLQAAMVSGVDWLITDRPDLALTVRAERSR